MRIVCIHQSAELYGSDRSFLQVIKYLKQSKKNPDITVVLPEEGPLVNELKKLNVHLKFFSLSLISKTYLRKFQFYKLFFPLFSLRKKYKFLSQFDIVYTNTSVILDLYLLAPFLKKKKIIHIREIPRFPVNHILTFFICTTNWVVLFNSNSTKQAFGKLKKSYVIHNAFEGFSDFVPAETKIRSDCNELNLLLIGRINTWKGQEFSIEALSFLKDCERIKLKIIGSTSKGNEVLLEQLKTKVKKLSLEDKIDFVDFITDPFKEYLWADVVIVPSIKPEPFGRVAIDGMSLKKPVIAANHGGLTEIISHRNNGFLFTPGNADEFISFIREYYYNKKLLKMHGENSLNIFKQKFSMNIMYQNLDKIF